MVKIFGILNITPDSFSDGGKFNSTAAALEQAKLLFDQGADYVDVGGESTRPGAQELSPAAEWERLSGFFAAVATDATAPDMGFDIRNFSLDTRKPDLAEKFLRLGGQIINDVSGFQDPCMIETLARHNGWCIVNHFPGRTIVEVHEQKICSINRIEDELLHRKEAMVREGIDPEKIILDPGIGFGKTMELNLELLKFAALVPQEKVMIGHSKKRFLDADRTKKAPNVEAAKVAMASGAWALRVHDPKWYKSPLTS